VQILLGFVANRQRRILKKMAFRTTLFHHVRERLLNSIVSSADWKVLKVIDFMKTAALALILAADVAKFRHSIKAFAKISLYRAKTENALEVLLLAARLGAPVYYCIELAHQFI
jgi:hypothetical protein